nr:STAS domain-containing protein [Couchioplanes caeruleus]
MDDAATYAQVQQAVLDLLLDQRPDVVLLDMGAVTFLDAAGIRALLTCRCDAQQLGNRLQIRRAHERVRRVLAICEVEHLFH